MNPLDPKPSLRMPRTAAFWSLSLVLLGAASAEAAVAVASPFTDHAVLQRELPVPVWGTGEAGETVTVSIDGQKVQAVADAGGHWKAVLTSLPVGGPYELTIAGSSQIVLKDILVGDVWLCSGQSNMEFTTAKALNGEAEVKAANFPKIRLYQVKKAAKTEVQSTCQGSWLPCDPTSVKDFSAVGYFFGRELAKSLDIPIGLINSSWGGTDAEAWVSAQALTTSAEFKTVFAGWDKTLANYPKAMEEYTNGPLAEWTKVSAEAKAAGKPVPQKPREPRGPNTPQHRPAALYNGMIAPLVPYGLRGAIWYQGENNAGGTRAEPYRRLLALLIADWREQFGNEFPFHIVQLANYNKDDPKLLASAWPIVAWPVLRESQAVVAATVPKAGMAVTIDIGNPENIHPTNKQEVGRRLALSALAKDYGKAIEYSGPVFKSMTIEGSTAVVTFDHAEGLAAASGALTGFTIAGEDGLFKPATGEISGTTVRLTSAEVRKPIAVRYAWANSPTCNLINGAGLPAGPFRFPLK
jgi:sialate O-acetylesterase